MKTDWLKKVKEYAESRGGECLEISKNTSMGIAKLKCHKNHEWSAVIGRVFYNKQWCHLCKVEKQKITFDEAVKIGSDHGFICISKEYKNALAHMSWKCTNGHIFESSYSSIKRGNGCKYCSRVAKYAIEEVVSLSRNLGFVCLDDEYINNKYKMNWKCLCGYIFSCSFHNIMNGKLCKRCCGDKILIKAQNIAKQYGGKCLSEKYEGSSMKIHWCCSSGHEWYAKLNSVKDCNTWCKECMRFKTQYRLRDIIKDIYGDVSNNYKNFEWLGKQEIDIFVSSIRLAIEYDGEQHYFPVRFGGCSDKKANEKFKKICELDIEKNIKISEHSDDIKYFIRFNYREKKKINRDYVIQKLQENNIPVVL